MKKFEVWVSVQMKSIIEAESAEEAREDAEEVWDWNDFDVGNFEVIDVKEVK